MGLLIGNAAAAAEADDAPNDSPLWLAAPTPLIPLPNFTADAPLGNEATFVEPAPIVAGSGEVSWKWVMPRLPAPYVGAAGASFDAMLTFEGLERVTPVHRDAQQASSMGRLSLRVDVLRLSSDSFVASGTTTLDAILLTDAPSLVTASLTMSAEEPFVYGVEPGNAPLFGIKVTLLGMATNAEAPTILVGDPGYPSYLIAPGFPVGALLQWSSDARLAAECNERILQGLDCAPAKNPRTLEAQAVMERATPVLVEEAAGLGPLSAMAFGMMLLYLARMRIRRAPV